MPAESKARAAKGAGTNGNAPAVTPAVTPAPDALADAISYEEQIAADAAEIRGEATALTPDLFLKLLPLIRRPIPAGFIVTTEPTKGKPYPSTGIKSMQVQIDRLDNVLTPLSWGWRTDWSDDMRTAEVVVNVFGTDRAEPLVTRRARGGVNQGSTDGNILKGSETNAAKLAFARLGVGHEVYLGAADFDPDVDPDAAKEQGKAAPVERVNAERAAGLRDLFDKSGKDVDKLKVKLGALGVSSARSVNQALATLTPGQADELAAWLEVSQ